MRKRTLLKSLCALPALGWAGHARADGRIAVDDVSFDWHHTGDALTSTLTAPTRGWVAVGFNGARRLEGTRFVIAERADGVPRFAERIAVVPTHEPVEAFGLTRALHGAELRHIPGGSRLTFSYPTDLPGLALAPGSATHLMLAWSHAPEFDHHSAWRRHLDITL
ncbi:MAG: hypothetical protein AAFQ51_06895 [Pseudomonadota bacterium]